MFKRKILFCFTLFFMILFISSMPASSSNDTNQTTDIKPYEKITLRESELTLSAKELQAFSAGLRKNLIYLKGLSEERADQIIENGTFESRIVEVGNVSGDKIMWHYVATANITVWKSEDYFAVCAADEATFTPYLGERQIDMVGSEAWVDVEEGELKPHDKSEVIVVVIGRTVSLDTDEIEIAPTKLYLEKISITY